MNDLSGQYLGRYYLSERLGEGGMAIVYKAYDTRLERDVAIKIIRSGAFPSDDLDQILKRFEREAKSLAKLSHPNIVKVHDYGEHEGSPYLVMEYLPGGTLKKKLGKPLPWQEAVRLILPVARGVSYAHQRGILHRDIKPANILITDSGEPMLSDFGIAKLFEADQTTALTGSGMAIGTPEYMAPEQWSGTTSPQSDLYSLGIVLYEMVAGRKPYIADTPAAILIKQATEPLPSPRKFAENLPEAIELVLIKALVKEPAERYTDMDAFITALENLLLSMTLVPAISEEKNTEETLISPSQESVVRVSAQAQTWKAGKTVHAVTEKDTKGTEKLEVTEKKNREKVEQIEKEKRETVEKAKRERAERQATRKAVLTKTFFNLSTTLKSALPKAKPGLRVIGIFGVIVVLFWLGSRVVPGFVSLKPTASPLPPTKTQAHTEMSLAEIGNLGNFYFTSDHDGTPAVYLLNTEGKVVRVMRTDWQGSTWSPAPDGRGNLYFTSDHDGTPAVYLLNTKGEVVRVMRTEWQGSTWSPAPDGQGNLYFTSDHDGIPAVYLLNTDGEVVRVMRTEWQGSTWSPAPDGQGNLYFTSDHDGTPAVYLLNTKGEVVRVMRTEWQGSTWSPAPDGQGNLYFTSDHDGIPAVYLLNTKGKVVRVMRTDWQGSTWSPAPDGRGNLYFTSDHDGNTGVFLLSAKGIVYSVSSKSWTGTLDERYPDH